MVVVNVDMVLGMYNSLLNNKLSYSEADRWAWNMMQESDNGTLLFQPSQDEELIWELIQFLYGIDMPDMEDRSKTARKDIDIIDFLKQKNVYEKTKALN